MIALETARVPYNLLDLYELWSTTPKIRTGGFNYYVLHRFCILLHCQLFYMGVSVVFRRLQD